MIYNNHFVRVGPKLLCCNLNQETFFSQIPTIPKTSIAHEMSQKKISTFHSTRRSLKCPNIAWWINEKLQPYETSQFYEISVVFAGDISMRFQTGCLWNFNGTVYPVIWEDFKSYLLWAPHGISWGTTNSSSMIFLLDRASSS